MVSPEKIINVSRTAAHEAGNIIVSSVPSGIKLKSRTDYLTATDMRCQDKIKEIILAEFPGHNILAEEDNRDFVRQDDLWIVDPLDGTTNFIHGLKHSAVSIAYFSRGEVRAGVIYDPYKNEMFHAVKGHGAYLNGNKISVSAGSDLGSCLIATGMPFRRPEKREKYFVCLSEMLGSCSGIRRMGSAALDIAYVACGRFDGFFEGWLSVWDIAAGAVIIEEVGGRIADFKGRDNYLNNGCVVCSGKDIYDRFSKIVNKNLKDEQ